MEHIKPIMERTVKTILRRAADHQRAVGASPILGDPFDPKNIRSINYGEIEEKILAAEFAKSPEAVVKTTVPLPKGKI